MGSSVALPALGKTERPAQLVELVRQDLLVRPVVPELLARLAPLVALVQLAREAKLELLV